MGEIVLDRVHKSYDGKTSAVEEISYTVQQGHFVTLLGPSGCGKSTTLNMIAGLEDVSGGTITIDGGRVDELPPDKRDLAFVFQDYALYPHMTVYENMAFGLRMRKTPKADIDRRVRDAAERLSLEPFLDRKPRDLSGGQRQRVALGRAIARRPAVFLFDEPLSNLDALLRDRTRTELKQLHQELGATSVYVTHDQEEALTLSDKIAVMSRGRLEQYGTPQEIYDSPATEFVAVFVGKPSINLFDAELDGGRLTVPGTGITVPGRGVTQKAADRKVRLGLRPDELVVHEQPQDGDVRATVKLIQPLGHATDVAVTVAGTELLARAPGFLNVRPGQEVGVDVSGARLHVFTADGTRRLSD
ncbi:putative ABC transporter ATP-binding protein [Actinacidiphila reveromycinica]|uniref:Putative ABC transporter ATP-binding protein n=1 Tax=Actinacidiphila reveromycinica TaxID=659352 RepID=A0A7U3UR64_9ACTN|nr:sn-glycerol-3-phosphate ABC transporter ATP-binding protein UgpC [Streptomyces sp. SN-593]BBA97237.1 putative ABC transporter ATP-binding protein [Streptomyces sp. SN-593]